MLPLVGLIVSATFIVQGGSAQAATPTATGSFKVVPRKDLPMTSDSPMTSPETCHLNILGGDTCFKIYGTGLDVETFSGYVTNQSGITYEMLAEILGPNNYVIESDEETVPSGYGIDISDPVYQNEPAGTYCFDGFEAFAGARFVFVGSACNVVHS